MSSKVELTNEEIDGLRQVLKHVLDVRTVELHRTDAFAFKELVKTNIGLIQQVLAKLEQARPPASK